MASFTTFLLKKLLPLQNNELYFTPVNCLSMEVPRSLTDSTGGVIVNHMLISDTTDFVL